MNPIEIINQLKKVEDYPFELGPLPKTIGKSRVEILEEEVHMLREYYETMRLKANKIINDYKNENDMLKNFIKILAKESNN